MRFTCSTRTLTAIYLLLALMFSATPLWAEGENDPLWNRPTYEKKLVDVGQRILAANGITEQISFNYVADSVKNATAGRRSGSTVTVHKGIIQYIESDDELAALLGHEIAHITMRHGRRLATASMGPKILQAGLVGVLLASGGGVSAGAASGLLSGRKPGSQGLLTQGMIKPYQRTLETEADNVGLNYMVRAGYNPLHMERFWGKALSGDGNPWRAFWSTHPMGRTRLDNVRKQIALNYPQFLTPEIAKALPGSQYELQPQNKGAVPTRTSHMAYTVTDAITPTPEAATTEIVKTDAPTDDIKALEALIAGKPTQPAQTAQAQTSTTAYVVGQSSTQQVLNQTNTILMAQAVNPPSPDTTHIKPPRKINFSKPQPVTIASNESVSDALLTLSANEQKLIRELKQTGYMEMTDATIFRVLGEVDETQLDILLMGLQQKNLVRLVSNEPQGVVLSDAAKKILSGD